MSKPVPSVEWIVVESDGEWERLPSLTPPPVRPNNHRLDWQRYLWPIGILLLVSAGGWWGYSSQTTLPLPTAPGPVTPKAVFDSIPSVHQSLVDTVVGDQTNTDWRRQFHQDEQNSAAGQPRPPIDQVGIKISKIEYLKDWAIVSLVMSEKRGASAYRQTRFYHWTKEGWLHTTPDAALWGPVRQLETASLAFHFRQNDAQTVATVAPQIEALYTSLRYNFGLPIAYGLAKRVINVSMTQQLGLVSPPSHLVEELSVPSPAIYPVPLELTDAQILAQSLVLPLLDDVLTQAIKRHAIRSPWPPLLNGLRLWQVWDLNLPSLGHWQREVVKWLYVNRSASRTVDREMLPGHYPAFCTAHQQWLPNLHIDLLCREQERQLSVFSARRPQAALIQLDLLTLVKAPGEQREQTGSSEFASPGQTIALATVIEYAVATYGRARLPALVAGLGQHKSWNTLLPAVYGVSPTAFEAGWQAYLVAHHGVALATFEK